MVKKEKPDIKTAKELQGTFNEYDLAGARYLLEQSGENVPLLLALIAYRLELLWDKLDDVIEYMPAKEEI